MTKFNEKYNYYLLETSLLDPKIPKGVKKSNKIGAKGTNIAFNFQEFKFKTNKDNIVKVQFMPDGDNSVEIAFTVNDSYEDDAGGGKLDPEIISGVLGIVQREVEKNKWDEIIVKPKKGQKDYKIKRNSDLEGAKQDLQKALNKVNKFRKENDADKWLKHLINDDNTLAKQILTGEWDASKIADMLYMQREPVRGKGNYLDIEKEFAKALDAYGIAIETKKGGGKEIPYNRRMGVFRPLLKKYLPNYEMDKFEHSIYMKRIGDK